MRRRRLCRARDSLVPLRGGGRGASSRRSRSPQWPPLSPHPMMPRPRLGLRSRWVSWRWRRGSIAGCLTRATRSKWLPSGPGGICASWQCVCDWGAGSPAFRNCLRSCWEPGLQVQISGRRRRHSALNIAAVHPSRPVPAGGARHLFPDVSARFRPGRAVQAGSLLHSVPAARACVLIHAVEPPHMGQAGQVGGGGHLGRRQPPWSAEML